MKLTSVRVRSFRSLFDFSRPPRPFVLDLADGMNLLVGPNNCGKSNVIRAVELALEPSGTIDPATDRPKDAHRAQPAVELRFELTEEDPARPLLDQIRSLRPAGEGASPASGEHGFTYRVRFVNDERRAARRIADFGFDAHPYDARRLTDTVDLLHQQVRFVVTRSGESLESILEGRFRHVLRDVVQETLREQYDTAIARRESYLDDLQAELFEPLTQQVTADLAAIFPEVNDVELRPIVPEIDSTIASLAVRVADSAITDLAAKGTGLRGGVIAAMLRYLATHSKHSMVFAVEEPEAFLHPGAQEGLRESLELLAERPDVTVLATTHSPFMVPRRHDAKLIALSKDRSGATQVEAQARGDEPQASLIGGLFRDPKISYVLDQVHMVRPEADAVLVVEGETDVILLRTAARLLGRNDVLDRFHIAVAGGATRAVEQTLILQAGIDRPVCALFDNDLLGRAAYDQLRDKAFSRAIVKTNILNYLVGFKGGRPDVPYEAEDLFSTRLQLAFAELQPEGTVIVGEHPRGVTHLEFPVSLKLPFAEFVAQHAEPDDVDRWARVLDALAKRLDDTPPSQPVPPVQAPVASVVPAQAHPAAEPRPTDSSTEAEVSAPPSASAAERRHRPTELESMLNGADAPTKRVKAVLDVFAAGEPGISVHPKKSGYSYQSGGRTVAVLWAEYMAVDVFLDHLPHEARSIAGEHLGALGFRTDPAKPKRQVKCEAIVKDLDWFVDQILRTRVEWCRSDGEL